MADKESEKQPEKPAQVCGNCKHYGSQGGKSGLCQKYPPQVTFVPKLLVQKGLSQEYTHVPMTAWPTVKQDDRCGEFEYAPGKKPKSQVKPEIF